MISLLMVAATLNAMAVTYSGKVKVRLTSSDSKYCEAVVATSNEFTDGLNNSYYAPFNDENKDVHLYVDYEGTRYAHFGSSAATMQNMPLIMKANSATSYSFTFSAIVGTIRIYDKKMNHEIDFTTENPYNFTIEASERDAENIVADRFIINYVPAPVYDAELTTNADGWASFAFGSDLEKVESELVIYKGEYNDNSANPEIALTEIADIPANAGVFVKGAANTTYHFNIITAAAADMTGNDIVACVAATPVSTFGTDAIYTLRYANGATALYQYVGTADIPAHKAVLPIAGLTPSSAPKRISMRINGTQAVDNVEAIAPAEKFVENGQVLIRRGEAVYNLQGQMVK